jgi:hypothetical protein
LGAAIYNLGTFPAHRQEKEIGLLMRIRWLSGKGPHTARSIAKISWGCNLCLVRIVWIFLRICWHVTQVSFEC